MAELEGIRTGRHWSFCSARSLGLVTKFRHRVFGDQHLARMEEIMRAVCADFETELIEFNGENNHVHLLVNFPPKVALAKLVNSLKGVSSRRMRQEFTDLVQHYYRARFVLRRLRRRRPALDRDAVHRAAEPPGLAGVS